MRTTVSLPEPLLNSAKRRARQRGVTLSEVVEDALRMHLASSTPRSKDAFRLYTVRGKLVDTGLDLDRTSALTAQEDEAQYRR